MTTAHVTSPITGPDHSAGSERDPRRGPEARPDLGVDLGRARVSDGSGLWRIARDSGELDVNSPYSYLLWCRDFADTTAVARDAEGRPVGFVTGYLRPDAPRTLFVWQVAVDGSHRGTGVAGALLDSLAARVAAEHGLDRMEATVTPGNAPSDRMFRSYARRHGATVTQEVLFPSTAFPGPDGTGHEPEVLYRIGPLTY
ncbi:diaminobutyrate acetyltransferase [Streptomyces sp. SR27]|uniref:diaminobutyrate acetyltransferase n=1 Tax=Streptomyces sp. SR27 TaxID=3076630 RepID=UPI00295BE67C|nr:diaminobutyrate acetyltransferase [Streptomyces sp. SR27]MDV9191296.1 diaminobutyrate acetyltransferase [Streptomyces sp. SR27]